MGQIAMQGLAPFVVPKTTYSTAGGVVLFTDVAGYPAWTSMVTFRVDSGSALVALTPDSSGPFIEFAEGSGFEYAVRTKGLYIKGDGADCDVTVIALLDPTTRTA